MPLRGPERHLEFDSPYEGEKLRHQTVLMDEIVLPWAESLDGGNPRILDLASGQGMEASKLAEQGLVVVASDISQVLTSKSFHNNIVRSNAEQIPFSDNSFSGVLLKDAWIFFSPDTKKRVLSEMHRVLKPGALSY